MLFVSLFNEMNKTDGLDYTKDQVPSQNYNSNYSQLHDNRSHHHHSHLTRSQPNPLPQQYPFLLHLRSAASYHRSAWVEDHLCWVGQGWGIWPDLGGILNRGGSWELGDEVQCGVSSAWFREDSEEGTAKYLWFYLGITAIIITVSIKQQEFLRIGYYVHLMPNRDLTQ